MKIRFQVIQDGAVIFETTSNKANAPYIAELTSASLEAFLEKHPKISLFDDDVILQWLEDNPE